jgi:hypothetical protein
LALILVLIRRQMLFFYTSILCCLTDWCSAVPEKTKAGISAGSSIFRLVAISVSGNGLETAAQTTEVVDGEGADKVNSGRSAEPDTKTFSDVHRSFTTVTLTECDLHTCQ